MIVHGKYEYLIFSYVLGWFLLDQHAPIPPQKYQYIKEHESCIFPSWILEILETNAPRGGWRCFNLLYDLHAIELEDFYVEDHYLKSVYSIFTLLPLYQGKDVTWKPSSSGFQMSSQFYLIPMSFFHYYTLRSPHVLWWSISMATLPTQNNQTTVLALKIYRIKSGNVYLLDEYLE